MKLILTRILVTMSFSLTVNTLSAQTANADSSFIFIYRIGKMTDAAANWAIYIDGKKICKLSNNKFIKVAVKPGKHIISARVAGVGVLKKQTELKAYVEPGGSNYIACNVINHLYQRARLEMIEVPKSSAYTQMEKMAADNCEEEIEQDNR